MRYVFFSMRNFIRDGGGSIRMYGILNALAEKGHDVVFISNATTFFKFDKRINHINIDCEITSVQKSNLQGLTSLLPASTVWKLYPVILDKIKIALEKANSINGIIYFFEYLDNSLAYLLKKEGVISGYINDQHGIATLEFQYQANTTKNIKKKIIALLKYKLADILDRKVFEYGDGFIYASKAMKNYFYNKYKLEHKKSFIIPYVLGKELANSKVDLKLKTMLQEELGIKKTDFVFFFAGGYKPTAGVQDLINAFSKFSKNHNNGKLILIGTGPTRDECDKLIKANNISEKVLIIDKIPYEELPTYQSLASIIVCPDRQNPYSNLIVHLKYFDSLASGKIVINGDFESVKEINTNNFLSPTFIPSDFDSLLMTFENCFNNFESISNTYKNTRNYTLEHLTYENYVYQLTDS